MNPTAGVQYTASIGEFDPATLKLTSLLHTTAVKTFAAAGVYKQFGEVLAAPLDLLAGHTYALWLSRQDGGPTGAQRCYYKLGGSPMFGYGLYVPDTNGIKIASIAPAVGDAWAASGAVWTAFMVIGA